MSQLIFLISKGLPHHYHHPEVVQVHPLPGDPECFTIVSLEDENSKMGVNMNMDEKY